MKYLLLGTAAALVIGSASQAQVAFSKGVGSLSYGSSSSFGDDFSIIGIEFDTAFNAGNFGFQISAGSQTITNFTNSFGVSNFELHGYKNTGSGNKFGAFIADGSGIFFGGGSNMGVEGMIGLGALDVEASVGYLSGSGIDLYLATFDVYFDVTSNLEVNAGYNVIFFDTESFSNASVGAAYAFGNSGYALTAGYTIGLDGTDINIVDVGLSWEFGPNTDERLFGDRYFDIFSFGGI